MIRVLIVDDHQLMRQGVVALLLKAKDLRIVGEARDGQEAVELAERLQPDVILMDIEMPRLNGLRATEQLTRSGSSASIIILSMRSDADDVREAIRSGAQGYLIKNSSREDLIAAIRAAAQGRRVFSPEVSGYLNSDAEGDT